MAFLMPYSFGDFFDDPDMFSFPMRDISRSGFRRRPNPFFLDRNPSFPSRPAVWRSVSHKDSDNLNISINMRDFEPEDITIKTTDKDLIVEGKSEVDEDGEYTCKILKKRFDLPPGVTDKDIESQFLPNKVLRIKSNNKRRVPIEMENGEQESHNALTDGKEKRLKRRRLAEGSDLMLLPGINSDSFWELFPLSRTGAWQDLSKIPMFEEKEDHYAVEMDAEAYKPESINVDIINNNVIKMEAKEEDGGHGHYSIKHVVKQYQLPPNTDPKNVKITLTKQGKLRVIVPKETGEKKTD